MTRSSRYRLLADAERQAREQGGVISRRQLYHLGLTRWQVRAMIVAGRWRSSGRQTVSVCSGPLSLSGSHWRAVLEVGPRASLDGLSALRAVGLRTIDEAAVHVIVPKSSTPLRPRGVTVHESRRFREEDVVQTDVRRMRPPVALVHAALWARSDRAAALYVAATVQQRIVNGADLLLALDEVRRHPRRRLLGRLAADVIDGAHALGELDLGRGLRRRALPPPVRQAVRVLTAGKVYLDADWPGWGLSLEVDGSQHDRPADRLADTLRDLDVAATGTTVLRIPLLALRIDEEAVLDRIETVFRARGWRAARSPSSSTSAAAASG
jgi:hypothetical protein